MQNLVGVFLEQGLLGVITLAAFWFALSKDKEATVAKKDLLDEQKNHSVALQEQAAAHKNDLAVLADRNVTKAETWMQQYYELGKAQNSLLDALEDRYGR